jgi:hypothetical protein
MTCKDWRSLSRFFLLLFFAAWGVAQANASTTVSVGFENGFIGEYDINAHQPESIKTFSTLGINSVIIAQQTDNGQFGGSQGNDYSVTVTILFSNGATSSFPAAVNWRDGSNPVHGIGLTVAPGTVDGTAYTTRSGFSTTYLLKQVASTRNYVDTATGQQLNPHFPDEI